MGSQLPIIEAKKHSIINDFFTNKKNQEDILSLDGPAHFFFPQVLKENISLMKQVIGDTPIKVFLAHKATHSSKALKTALQQGINVDVSSLGELKHALACGFSAEQIECTGPKNDSFLRQAIKEGCTISIDSVNELRRIAEHNTPTAILVRIANPVIKEVYVRRTKFGVSNEQLEEVYSILLTNKQVTLRGFHVHQDGLDPRTRAVVTEYLLTIIQEARQKGFMPEIINLGGAFKTADFTRPNEWGDFVEQIQEAVSKSRDDFFWDKKAYNIIRSEKRSVTGARRISTLAHIKEPTEQLNEFLETTTSHDVSLKQLLQDCLVELWLEPGMALLGNTGITSFPVIEEKTIGKDDFLLCDATNFTVGTKMFEPYADPELIPTNNDNRKEYFLTGLLCREDDVLMNRKVSLPIIDEKKKQALVFFNTGAYRQGFEETKSQLQAQAKKYVIKKKENDWVMSEEEKLW